LERRHLVLLVLLGTASFFDGYDIAIKNLALTQIRDSFDLTKSAASAMLAVVYFGALPAMVLTRLADRVGRRRMLIVSVLGYTSLSGLTALAPSATWFAGLQFFQQLFLVAEIAVVATLAAEELPAKARGYGFGILGMNLTLGMGAAAMLYGGVFEPAGISWRWLYVASVPPMLLVAFLRRSLPESRRFEAVRERGQLARRWQEIFRPPYGHWLVLVVVTTFLLQLPQQAIVFTVDFLQTDRGIDTSTANGMLALAGTPGIAIMVMAGRWSDRYGRRLVGCGFALASTVGSMGMFWLPGGTGVLFPCMVLAVVGGMGSFPVLATFTSELFPTALRGSAQSWNTAAGVLGRTASLGIAAVLLDLTSRSGSSQSWTATCLTLGPIVALATIALAFPDTHGRELEETSAGVSPHRLGLRRGGRKGETSGEQPSPPSAALPADGQGEGEPEPGVTQSPTDEPQSLVGIRQSSPRPSQ
jgi:putative MFS transporter